MTISKCFLVLALAFVVVLLIASEASAGDLLAAETVQAKEIANAKVDGYHRGHGHGHHGHYGHHEHHGHHRHEKGHHGHHEHHGHHGHGKGHHGYYGHGHHGHGKGHHGHYSYHSVDVGTNAGN